MNKEKIIKIFISWLIVLITIFMIVNFSLQNSQESTTSSDRIVDSIIEVLPDGDKITTVQRQEIQFSVRKLAHFGIYMLLGFTLINAMIISFKLKSYFIIIISLFSSFVFSVFDEFAIQGSSQGRAPQWTDVLIDTIGATVGILVFVLILFIYNKILYNINKNKEIHN